MSDFTVNIDSTLDLSKAESKMNEFLNKYKDKPIKIRVEPDIKRFDTGQLGKQLQSTIGTAVKGIKIDGSNLNPIDFAKTKKNIQSEVKDIAKTIQKSIPDIIDKDANKIASQYVNKRAQEYSKLINSEQKYQKQFKQSQDKLTALQSKDISKYEGTASYNQITTSLEKATELQSRLNAEMSKGESSNFDNINSDLKEMNSLLSKSETAYNNLTKPLGTFEAITASNKTLSWIKNNTKASKELGNAFDLLAEKQKRATTSGELEQYNKEFRQLTSYAQSKGLTGLSFTGEFGKAFNKIFQFSQIYGGIDRIFDTIGNAVSELKEMDDILTEISKVSDMTTAQIKQLGEDSFDYANKYGKNVTDYLSGVTEMNRSGYYGQRGIDLANVSVLAQAAGDMTDDVANAYLLATNAAYEYSGSAEKLNAVLDGQNMITNRNSVNMTDMAEATTQAGSMAAQAGVQVDQLSALIGTAVARTKKDGNEVGTALKSLFINLQNTQNQKIVGTFDDLGISMTKMVGDSEQLKTPIELLEELSKAYTTLPDGSVTKANILTNIGGKHHANVLSSILSGYSDYEKMLQDYSQGAGSAANEAEKSANNWSGSLNKLSNSWTEFIGNFVQSDQVITGIKSINGIVDAIDLLVNTVTPLGTIVGGAGVFSFFKNLDEPKKHGVSVINNIFSYINTTGLADIRNKHNGVCIQVAEHGEFYISI